VIPDKSHQVRALLGDPAAVHRGGIERFDEPA
jgi:hypothetical protein